MSNISLYVSQYDKDKGEAVKVAEREASRLESKELKLLEVVEALGDYINSDDSSNRVKSVSYLADVIGAVPPRVLSLQQRNLLCDFVLSRLADDPEGVNHYVRTLLALEDRGPWDRARAASIIKSILEQTHPLRQHKSQADRFTILSLIDRLMSKYRDAVRNLVEGSTALLQSLATYSEGEKDPRNLMLVFSNLQIPMIEWDISEAAQDFFNAVFDYFPITFKPPPNDPYGITPEQLKDRLRGCIASTDALAPFAVPALLDKLDATSPNTKRESLEALRACAKIYTARTLSRYSVTIWDALKYEVWNMEDDSIAESVLQTLTAMASRLSDENEYLRIFMSPVAKECREQLEDIPTKQSKIAETVVSSISRASSSTFNYLAAPLVEYLLNKFEKADSVTKLHGVLEILVEITRSSSSAFGEWSQYGQRITDSNISVDAQEFDWKEKLFSCFYQIASSNSTHNVPIRVLAFHGLKNFCKVKTLLEDYAIIRVLKLSCETAIDTKSSNSQDIHEVAIDVLKSVAEQRPQLILNETIPFLVAKLSMQSRDRDDCYEEVLEVLAKIGTVAKVRTTVVIRLKNHLIDAIQENAREEYIEVVVAALLYAVSANEEATNFYGRLAYDDVSHPILSMLFAEKAGKARYAKSYSVLAGLGKISNILVRKEGLELQVKLVPEVYRLHRDIQFDDSSPFGINFENNSYETMILSTYLLASFRREIQLPFNLTNLLNALVKICLEQQISATVRAILYLQVSIVVNKFLAQTEVDAVVENILSMHKLMEKHDVHSTKVTFFLAKALLLRGHRCAYHIITELLDRLGNAEGGLLVAHCFTTLLHPAEIMTEQNHFILKLGLHKQRLFNMLLSTTVQSLKNQAGSSDIKQGIPPPNTPDDDINKAAIKRNHLLALAGITRSVSYHHVIEPELHTFFPLLLQSLEFTGDDHVRITATDTLLSAIVQSPRIVEEHVSGVLTRLLNMACANALAPAIATAVAPSVARLQVQEQEQEQEQESLPLGTENGKVKLEQQQQQQQQQHNINVSQASPKLRAAALQCLALMPSNLRGNVLIPFRRNVIKQLVAALDDRKRSVRVQAVRCKARWVELDEPDDDDD